MRQTRWILTPTPHVKAGGPKANERWIARSPCQFVGRLAQGQAVAPRRGLHAHQAFTNHIKKVTAHYFFILK